MSAVLTDWQQVDKKDNYPESFAAGCHGNGMMSWQGDAASYVQYVTSLVSFMSSVFFR